MKVINIRNIEIEYLKKNIKNIHLWVYPPNWRVRVASPMHIDEWELRVFLQSKMRWILKNKQKFLEQNRESPREYVSWESHYYLWKRYLLEVIKSVGKEKVYLKNKKYLVIETKIFEKNHVQLLLEKWYRNELKQISWQLLSIRQEKMWLKSNELKIKKMKTKRWTCNTKAGRIWLNLHLIKKSIQSVEYVLVHELAHFQEKNHWEWFKKLLTQHLSNWKQIQKDLNNSILSDYYE